MRTIIPKPLENVNLEEKTVTASRTKQEITADEGYLSKVTVNKFPDANGKYTAVSNANNNDMGADNNYRYVDTTALGQNKTVRAKYTNDPTGVVVTPDSGKYLDKVTIQPFQHTETQSTNTTHASGNEGIDLGIYHNKRYIDTQNAVKKTITVNRYVGLEPIGRVTVKYTDGNGVEQTVSQDASSLSSRTKPFSLTIYPCTKKITVRLIPEQDM